MKKLMLSAAIAASMLFAANVHTDAKTQTVHKSTKHAKKSKYAYYNFHIVFKAGSSTIQKQYLPKIKDFAEFMKKHPKYRAVIIGFTDNKGSKKYNILLSEKRAKAVYEELIKFGVSKKRLSYKGEGGAHPIASNKTAKGRAENRRVVAVIIK